MKVKCDNHRKDEREYDKKDNENVFSLYVSMYRYSWKCTNYTSGRRID